MAKTTHDLLAAVGALEGDQRYTWLVENFAATFLPTDPQSRRNAAKRRLRAKP